MKKILMTAMLIMAMVLVVNLSSQDVTYVGSAKCKMCHKSEKQGEQFPQWEARKHSKSFTALSTDEAKELAADAPDNPKCLKCHAPLAEKNAELKEEGVGCETCHGPGSAYKKMTIMKDHAQAVTNGLIDYKSEDDIKKQCLTCHEGAHDKPFDFAAAWEKVKHPIPEK
jgi:hypothetical protein